MLIMAVTASDVQFWLWKVLKASSMNCVVIMLKYPLISCFSLCSLFLYMCFPLIFWILIYSSPLVVLIPILRRSRSVQDGHICGEKEKKDENNVVGGEDGKPFRRVHSVRRRRAKEIKREDNNEEEKIAVPLTSFNADQVIDKSTLIEESTTEICDVEVDSSASAKDSSSIAFQNSKPVIVKDSHIKSLDGSDEDEEGEKEDQDNVMEVGISEIERNKRLESLIARRRARKLLSLQVRRTLMNMDKNDLPAPIPFPSLVIPKHNNGSFLPNSSFSSHISTSPGSAPSIFVPMRNPFDLPYDPQEEKPDLTGDSFQQEFTSPPNKDVMFCRHESFSLGPSLPEEFNQGKEKASFQHDFRFRHRASQQGYEFYTPAPYFHMESSRILEPESTQGPETNSISDTEDDQIKEVIQECENGTDKNGDNGKAEMKPVPKESSSTTSSSSSSSEEDTPFFKIDKEAVLINLFSPRTPAARANEINRIGDNSNYFASPLKRNNLEEHMYQANRTMRRHAPSYSIASDLQVEFSEVSSPQTVDDNEDASDMEQKIDLASGNLSSDLFGGNRNEYRLRELDEISEGDLLEVGYSRINSSEDLSSMDEDPVIEEHKIHSCYRSDSLQEKITDVFGVNGSEYSSREIDEISEDVGYSRVNSSEDLANTIRDSVIEERKIQTSFISDSLQEKLPESLQFPAQENGQQSTEYLPSHGNDFPKQLDDSTIQNKQFKTPESETIDHVEGQSSKPAECHLTEHSAEGNVMSSEDSGESEEKVVTPVVFEIRADFENHEGEPSSANQTTLDSDNTQEISLTQDVAFQRIPFFQSSTTSPKSVLQPSFSVDLGSTTSFDQYLDQEHSVRNDVEVLSPAGSHNLSPTIEQSTALPSSDANGDVRDVQISQESAESSIPYVETENIDSINELKSHENGVNPEEVAGGSSQSETLSINEAPPEQFKLIEETSSNCFNNHDEIPSKSSKATNPTAYSEEMDNTNNSNSLRSVDEDLFKHQEVTGGVVKHDDSNISMTYMGQTENSTLDDDTGHEHTLDNQNDHKGTTTSNCLGETR